MSQSSSSETNFIIHAWIWEACVTLDFKDEASRIEKEIEDLDSLRKYFIDDKNTSLLIAVRKLGNILEELHMEEGIQDVLSKLQVLTIDLLEDNNLQSEVDVVRNLLCFHHYCVLMLFEIEREFADDILLPALPIDSEQWEMIKNYFKFKEDTYKEDLTLTLKVFYKCLKEMAERERDYEMFSDLVNSIRSRLTKFCGDLRKLLSTPTLVKIHENDIEYLYYKSLDIPRCDLILKEIRDHGVTPYSLNVVFDLLFKTTEDMTLSNSEELLPTIGVVSELRKNRISTETIVSGTTSNSTLSPYGVLCFESFLNRPMHEDSYAEIPLSVVKEESGSIEEVTTERDKELGSESLSTREKESQMRDNSEPISGCPSAEKTEPQRKNQEIFHNTIHVLGSLLKDAKKVLETIGIFKDSATLVVNSCSEFEKNYSEFLESVTCTSKNQMEKLPDQYLKLENHCKESENIFRVGKLCKSDSTPMNSTIRNEEDSEVANDLNDVNMSTDSELSMPILTSNVDLEIEDTSSRPSKENSMPFLSPQREPTSLNIVTSVDSPKNRSAYSFQMLNEASEKTLLCEANTDLNEDDEKQVLDTTTHFSPQNMSSNDVACDKRSFPGINGSNTQLSLDISSPTAPNESNEQQGLDTSLYIALSESGEQLALDISSPPAKISSNSETYQKDILDEQCIDMNESFELRTNCFSPPRRLSVQEEVRKIVVNESSSEPKLIEPSSKSKDNKPNSESKLNEPSSESKFNEPSSESKLNEPSSESKLNEPSSESIFNEPSSESKLNEPSSESKFNESSSESKLNEPSSESKFNEPSSESKLNEPSPESKLNESSSESKFNEPSPESKLNEPSSESIFNEPSSESKLNEPSSESKFNESSSESKLNEPSSESKFNEPSSESKLNEPIPESKFNEPSSESKFNEPSPESKLNEPSPESKFYEPSSESKFNEPSSESKNNEPSSEAKDNKPSFESKDYKPSSEAKDNESSSEANENNDHETNTSSYYSQQIDPYNGGRHEESNLNLSSSENEEPLFYISPRNCIKNKYFEDEGLETNSMSAVSSDWSTNNRDQSLTFSRCSSLQNLSFKDDVFEKPDLNESSCSKDKSNGKRASDISLQECLGNNNNNNTLKQQDAIEAIHSPADTKLESNPYVLLSPMTDPISCSGSSNSFDQKVKHSRIISESSSSTNDDKRKINLLIESKPSTSQLGLTFSRKDEEDVNSPDSFEYKRLFKRRRVMEIDSSFSEEEV
ncbi:UNVERIFIED_CONTAM: hypothetical protein RMT77_002383 [Armadillidium vulgare]